MQATILIAEDNVEMAELISRCCQSVFPEAEVRFLENGQEMLNYLFRLGEFRDTRREVPSLIIMDLDMPLVNGRSVISILKNDDRFKTIPTIVLTGNPHLEEKLMGIGADDYYIKPVELGHLRIIFGKIRQRWWRGE